MLTREHQRLKDFDALAFEEERYNIFQQTETPAPLSDSALDADWDARLGYEPTEAQWHDREYRAAYIQAVSLCECGSSAQKYDEKFGDLI